MEHANNGGRVAARIYSKYFVRLAFAKHHKFQYFIRVHLWCVARKIIMRMIFHRGAEKVFFFVLVAPFVLAARNGLPDLIAREHESPPLPLPADFGIPFVGMR